MIQMIYYILFTVTLLYGVYFVVTGLFAFKKEEPKIRSFRARTKFAVLIAARNEALVIEDLIKSLKAQNYPSDLFNIYSLINNCTDNTLEVARKAGSKIMNVTVPVKSKGDVLKFAFNKLKKKDYDAYIVFDADNVVHPDFLKLMNNTYLSGYKVAQGRKDSKNIEDNWLSASHSIFYYIQNFFFNKARMKIDAAAAINGTGFMVAKSVIDKEGFNPKTITEDIELSIQCVLNGYKIAYVEDAITYDEQVLKFMDSWNQRSRWSKGIIECNRLYRRDLLAKWIKDRDFSCIDKFMFSAAPYVQTLSVILTLVLGLFYVFDIELNDIFSYFFSLGFTCFMIGYLVDVILNMFVIVYYKRDLYDTLHGIFFFFIFMLSWIPINIICLFKKNLNWVQIEHNRKASMDALINEK